MAGGRGSCLRRCVFSRAKCEPLRESRAGPGRHSPNEGSPGAAAHGSRLCPRSFRDDSCFSVRSSRARSFSMLVSTSGRASGRALLYLHRPRARAWRRSGATVVPGDRPYVAAWRSTSLPSLEILRRAGPAGSAHTIGRSSLWIPNRRGTSCLCSPSADGSPCCESRAFESGSRCDCRGRTFSLLVADMEPEGLHRDVVPPGTDALRRLASVATSPSRRDMSDWRNEFAILASVASSEGSAQLASARTCSHRAGRSRRSLDDLPPRGDNSLPSILRRASVSTLASDARDLRPFRRTVEAAAV